MEKAVYTESNLYRIEKLKNCMVDHWVFGEHRSLDASNPLYCYVHYTANVRFENAK